jgi:hypothetical protein
MLRAYLVFFSYYQSVILFSSIVCLVVELTWASLITVILRYFDGDILSFDGANICGVVLRRNQTGNIFNQLNPNEPCARL